MRPGWFRAAAFSGLAVVLAVGSHLLFPVLRFERDVLLARTHGWGVLRRLAEPARLFPGLRGGRGRRLRAQLPARLAGRVYARRDRGHRGRRAHSQYDLWPEPAVAPGQDALWSPRAARLPRN